LLLVEVVAVLLTVVAEVLVVFLLLQAYLLPQVQHTRLLLARVGLGRQM
jgi:hypothetical protein